LVRHAQNYNEASGFTRVGIFSRAQQIRLSSPQDEKKLLKNLKKGPQRAGHFFIFPGGGRDDRNRPWERAIASRGMELRETRKFKPPKYRFDPFFPANILHGRAQ